ncbi:MAG: DUF2800 domain-containing protein, partial [Firmicutes bacterium]|nr:DUF2800 domain-containing protein [Bacillota bacterium]
MPTKQHAALPPSSAERWGNCPGSVTLSKQFPQDTTSTYAEEGTIAHAVAESLLDFYLHTGVIAVYDTPWDHEAEFACYDDNLNVL